jgi:hypothetical protein
LIRRVAESIDFEFSLFSLAERWRGSAWVKDMDDDVEGIEGSEDVEDNKSESLRSSFEIMSPAFIIVVVVTELSNV